ncbi:MAG: hypothetical protein ACE5LS_05115 [Thermoplasmata archaeon]
MTWDVDSEDSSSSSRLRRYVFGYSTPKNGKVYRYPGLLDRDNVRYIGQSVLFVGSDHLRELTSFLKGARIAHVVTEAQLGRIQAK